MLTELVLKELESAIISTLIEMPIDYGIRLFTPKAKKYVLIKMIRKREAYLKEKYKDRFTLPKHLDQDSFFEWLNETGTIKRILSFSNADDISNISVGQIQLCKEVFFKDAFEAAKIQTWHEKEELRIFLNELFQYVEELFWKTSNENDVFLYKKSLSEIKSILNDSVEEIKKKVDYHDSFAEYIDNQKVRQDAPYKLDYRSGEIPFVGRTEELKELDAFCACEAQISWWAVTGKGGSGKSRLAYQYIENHINSSDWKMCFLPDSFFKQSHEGGKYKLWITWFYHKNLLLVVDYVQRYAEETARWIEELSTNNSVTKKIRILLLERTGSEESLWYKGNFDKSVVASHKYEKAFLKLQSKDADLILFADKYAEKNKKQISEADAMDALAKLKTIDSEARILYFIMILEAIFNKKPWRNWNRNDLADYILKRELKNIEIRFEDNQDLLRSYSILLAFCTATKRLPFFEQPQTLPELISKEIEEIINACDKKGCSKDQLCALLQLEDDALQPVTPDIIGEYMVLHIIDQYFFTKEDKKQFTESMWTYDSDDFWIFIFRLFEDKIFEQFYDDIMDLIRFDAVPHDTYVMENYSKLMRELASSSDLERAAAFVKTLEKIYHDYPCNEIIAYLYAEGLLCLSFKQVLPERAKTIETLEQLSLKHANNIELQRLYATLLFFFSYNYEKVSECKNALERMEKLATRYKNDPIIPTTYAFGLRNLIGIQKLPERLETLEKLKELSRIYGNEPAIQAAYANGLVLLSEKQNLPEIKETIKKLEQLSQTYDNNVEIQAAYAKGLFYLSNKQNFSERKETLEKLEQFARSHSDNAGIQAVCTMLLAKLSLIQEFSKIKETIKELEQFARQNTDDDAIQGLYAKMLFTLSVYQGLPERKETIEIIKQISCNFANNVEIQAAYAKGLSYLCYYQSLTEIKENVEILKQLAWNHADNTEIQEAYAYGLFSLSDEQELQESRKAIKKLAQLAKDHSNSIEIQEAYAAGLAKLSKKQELTEINENIEELGQLTKTHSDNSVILAAYAEGLFYLSQKQKLQEKKASITKLEHLTEKYIDNVKIQTLNAMGLFHLSRNQPLMDAEETIGKLEKFACKHATHTKVQVLYALGLLNLSMKQALPERAETQKKLMQLQQEYADDSTISKVYGFALINQKEEDTNILIDHILKFLP